MMILKDTSDCCVENRLKERNERSRVSREEAVVKTWVRGSTSLHQWYLGKKWLNFRQIWKTEPSTASAYLLSQQHSEVSTYYPHFASK